MSWQADIRGVLEAGHGDVAGRQAEAQAGTEAGMDASSGRQSGYASSIT